jgi:hypothetical protein
MWVLWGLMWAGEIAFVDHSTQEFWPLVIFIVYVLGTLAVLAANLVVWFTLGRLIDAKAPRPWLWHLVVGLALGGFVAVALRDANPYALIAGLGVIALGGFGLGPLVAARTFVSVPWRIAVGTTVGLGALSLVAVLL